MNDAVHETSCALGLVEGEMQHLQVVKERATDVKNHTLPDIILKVKVGVTDDLSEQFDYQIDPYNSRQKRKVPSRDRLIDDQLHKDRSQHEHAHREDVAHGYYQEDSPVDPDEMPEASSN